MTTTTTTTTRRTSRKPLPPAGQPATSYPCDGYDGCTAEATDDYCGIPLCDACLAKAKANREAKAAR